MREGAAICGRRRAHGSGVGGQGRTVLLRLGGLVLMFVHCPARWAGRSVSIAGQSRSRSRMPTNEPKPSEQSALGGGGNFIHSSKVPPLQKEKLFSTIPHNTQPHPLSPPPPPDCTTTGVCRADAGTPPFGHASPVTELQRRSLTLRGV